MFRPKIQILINTARSYDEMANEPRKEGRTEMDCVDRRQAFHLRKQAREMVMEE